MTLLRLDHLALSAETLAAGHAHAHAALGAPLAPRGEHPHMGTHNHLLSLGPQEYFEVIAIDPDATPPGRPRWFNIDNFSGPPRLTNWILATDDMDVALAALPSGFGTPIHLQRKDFRWQMAVPDDGILPWGGWGPAIIQWEGDLHPAPLLQDHNIRLRSLRIRHPQADDMAALLAPLLPTDTALFEPHDTPAIIAAFDTPDGIKHLQ